MSASGIGKYKELEAWKAYTSRLYDEIVHHIKHKWAIRRKLRASNAALKAENEALKAQWIDHTKPGCGPSSAYCEELRAKLSLYTSWQPSDPGTKEAVEVVGLMLPNQGLGIGRAKTLVAALTAAMVRLEEAEKELGVRKDAERAIIENHCGTGCLACGSFWTDTGHGGKPWHKDGCQLAALTASLASEVERHEFTLSKWMAERMGDAEKALERAASSAEEDYPGSAFADDMKAAHTALASPPSPAPVESKPKEGA